jgi:glycerol uptake facilitator-like aquaporin
MGERLADGNVAIALLANTLATGAGLIVLISIFGPLSGAHFNPAVTLVFILRRTLGLKLGAFYVMAQITGAFLGVVCAHAMFDQAIIQTSTHLRDGSGQMFSEMIATFGLIGTILGAIRFHAQAAPTLIGLYITSAYWFTASTSFANPAVTLARAATNSFAGIAPTSAPLFIAGQLSGAVIAAVVFGWLFQTKDQTADSITQA